MVMVWWFNSDLDGYWLLMKNWNWDVFFVDDLTFDWDMDWIRHWLLNDVWNLHVMKNVEINESERLDMMLQFYLSDDLNWCWDGNLNVNMHSLFNFHGVWSGKT